MGYGVSYGQAGDPFLGGLIKGAIGAIGGGIKGAIGAFLPKPVSPFGGQAQAYTGPLAYSRPGMGRVPQIAVTKTPGIRGTIQRFLPGGATGYQPTVTGFAPRRRRMNPANPKALRRAIRRQDGFVKLARRALKGSGYTIVSRSSRRPRRDLGRGHTHVR